MCYIIFWGVFHKVIEIILFFLLSIIAIVIIITTRLF